MHTQRFNLLPKWRQDDEKSYPYATHQKMYTIHLK